MKLTNVAGRSDTRETRDGGRERRASKPERAGARDSDVTEYMLMRGTKRSSLVGPVKGGALELGRSGTRTTANPCKVYKCSRSIHSVRRELKPAARTRCIAHSIAIQIREWCETLHRALYTSRTLLARWTRHKCMINGQRSPPHMRLPRVAALWAAAATALGRRRQAFPWALLHAGRLGGRLGGPRLGGQQRTPR